jgi:hypothetical protein
MLDELRRNFDRVQRFLWRLEYYTTHDNNSVLLFNKVSVLSLIKKRCILLFSPQEIEGEFTLGVD